MALPTTLPANTTIITDGVFFGPFLSSGGNVYIVLADTTAKTQIRAFKATDPTVSFTAQSGGPSHTAAITGLWVAQDGDNLHIITASRDTSGMTPVSTVKYSVFAMNSDTWTLTGETVQTSYDSGGYGRCFLAVRSTGVIVAFYNGAVASVMGTNYSRIVYNLRTSGTWGGPVAADAGGTVNWEARGIQMGVSDRTHFIYGPILRERSLSGSTLSNDQNIGSYDSPNPGVYDPGNDRVYHPNTTPDLMSDGSPWMITFPSVANPAYTTTVYDAVTGAAPFACAARDGTTVHVIFTQTKNYHMQHTSNPHGITTWETADLISNSAYARSANIYTRGGTKMIGYVYSMVWPDMSVLYDEYPVVSATVVVLGRATETGTARTLTHSKLRVIGRATETDTSNAIHRVRFIAVGRATETGTARTLTHSKLRVIGRATETDLSRGIVAPKFITIGHVAEADLARGLVAYKIRTIARISETDAARTLKAIKIPTLGRVIETDVARTITASLPAAAVGHWGILISN